MDLKKMLRECVRLARDLPPIKEVLRASLFERSRRCGKPNCRCAAPDDAGHAVVCVSRSLPEGRTWQVSVPGKLVPLAATWIENYHCGWRRSSGSRRSTTSFSGGAGWSRPRVAGPATPACW